jgi:hypothetical protein
MRTDVKRISAACALAAVLSGCATTPEQLAPSIPAPAARARLVTEARVHAVHYPPPRLRVELRTSAGAQFLCLLAYAPPDVALFLLGVVMLPLCAGAVWGQHTQQTQVGAQMVTAGLGDPIRKVKADFLAGLGLANAVEVAEPVAQDIRPTPAALGAGFVLDFRTIDWGVKETPVTSTVVLHYAAEARLVDLAAATTLWAGRCATLGWTFELSDPTQASTAFQKAAAQCARQLHRRFTADPSPAEPPGTPDG